MKPKKSAKPKTITTAPADNGKPFLGWVIIGIGLLAALAIGIGINLHNGKTALGKTKTVLAYPEVNARFEEAKKDVDNKDYMIAIKKLEYLVENIKETQKPWVYFELGVAHKERYSELHYSYRDGHQKAMEAFENSINTIAHISEGVDKKKISLDYVEANAKSYFQLAELEYDRDKQIQYRELSILWAEMLPDNFSLRYLNYKELVDLYHSAMEEAYNVQEPNNAIYLAFHGKYELAIMKKAEAEKELMQKLEDNREKSTKKHKKV